MMRQVHQPSTVERVPLNKARKIEMRGKTFGATVNSLERAYTQFLYVACEDGPLPQVDKKQIDVRHLADCIKWRLHANCPKSETAGRKLLVEFLAHAQNKFKWQRIIIALEEALSVAREEKPMPMKWVNYAKQN